MPTATPFNNLITFSRGSNATVTGSNGLIQWAPNNLPTFSEQFDNVNWPKENITVIANTAIAPDGSSTAELMYPTTTGNNRRIIRSTTLTVGTVYAQSVYVKAAGKRWVYLNGIDATTAANNCWFDLQDGVVGAKGGSVLSAGITAVGNGWYRIFTVALAGANNYFYLMGVDGDNTITSTTNGTDGILIWGAQLELGSTATTYNPTTVKNLLGFSEAFDNAFWVKTRASIVTGAAANPVNGLFNAQKLMEDTTASNSHVITGAGGAVGSVETLSVYARAAGRQWLTFQIGTTASAYFNIGTGVLGTVTNGTASIVNIGGGWYRCSLTATRAGTTNNFIFLASADLTVNYTGDGNSGVYIYGAQLSDSASLDPYVPTPGAAPSSTAFYGPRFDFDPVTLQPRGILIEEQRTNILLQSGDISSASWESSNQGTALAPTVTGNAGTAPDGTNTATRLQLSLGGGTTTGDIVRRRQMITFTAVQYTFSIWIRSTNGSSSFNIHLQDPAGATQNITVTGSWTRYTVSGVGPVGTGYVSVGLRGGQTPANSATADILVWGGQLEIGAFATSYIPTVASTVTRSADVATISGSLFSQWYGQTEGTFVYEASALSGLYGYRAVAITRAAGGITDRIDMSMGAGAGGATGIFRDIVVVGGVTQVDIGDFANFVGNTAYKGALAYKPNDFAAATSGGNLTTDTSGTVPTVALLDLGNRNSANYLNGHIRSINFVPARAADFQLQALTAQSVVDYFFLQTAAGDQLVAGNDDYLYSLPILG